MIANLVGLYAGSIHRFQEKITMYLGHNAQNILQEERVEGLLTDSQWRQQRRVNRKWALTHARTVITKMLHAILAAISP